MATNRKNHVAPTPAGAATEGLKIAARSPKGIRRAGRHWGPEAETVSLADLTEEQVEQLRDDPGLVVVDCTIDEKAE